jgi:hypothetical protein
VLQASRARFPFIQKVFADERVADAASINGEIARTLPGQVRFQVASRRRVLECLPLCHLRHAADKAAGSFGLRFESDFRHKTQDGY